MSDLLFVKGFIQFNKRNCEDSIETFTRSVKEDRNNDQSRYYRSKAYLQVGKPRDARNDLTDLSAKNYLDSRQLLESLK